MLRYTQSFNEMKGEVGKYSQLSLDLRTLTIIS